MALHGLGSMTLGVPHVDEAREFYREFGLTEIAPGTFATRDGGEQLRVVERPVRQLVEVTLAADDPDDFARIAVPPPPTISTSPTTRTAASRCVEPVVGIRVRVAMRDRITQSPYDTPPMNGPGNTVRDGDRAPAIFDDGTAPPRRLGHVL